MTDKEILNAGFNPIKSVKQLEELPLGAYEFLWESGSIRTYYSQKEITTYRQPKTCWYNVITGHYVYSGTIFNVDNGIGYRRLVPEYPWIDVRENPDYELQEGAFMLYTPAGRSARILLNGYMRPISSVLNKHLDDYTGTATHVRQVSVFPMNDRPTPTPKRYEVSISSTVEELTDEQKAAVLELAKAIEENHGK